MTTGTPDPVFHYRDGDEEVDLYDTGLTAVDLDVAASAVPADTLAKLRSDAEPLRASVALVPTDALDTDTHDLLDQEGAILPVLSQNQPDDPSMVIAQPEARVIASPSTSVDDIERTLRSVGLELHQDAKQRLVATPTTRRAQDLLAGIQQLDDDDSVDLEAHPRFLRMVKRPDVGRPG